LQLFLWIESMFVWMKQQNKLSRDSSVGRALEK